MRTPSMPAFPRALAGALALAAAAPLALDAQQAGARLASTGRAEVPPAASLAWAPAAALPAGVDHHATFITGSGRQAWLHVAGGYSAGFMRADSWRARIRGDGSLGEWEKGDALPAARGGMAFASDGSVAALIGGKATVSEVTRDVYVARVWSDGRLGQFKAAPFPLPAPRFHNAAVIHDRRLYVLGGNDGKWATSTVFMATVGRDGSLSAWRTLDSLPGARSHQAAFVRDGYLYMVAGIAGNPAGDARPLGDVLRAPINKDGTLGAWATVSQLDSLFATHAAVVRGDWLYVVGGVENNRRFTDRVIRAPFQADGMLGAWETVDAPLPAARAHVHQVPMLGDRIYSVGGSQGQKQLPDVVIGTFTDGKKE